MSFSDFALALRWFGAVWLLGWLVLPVSRRLFPRLPDAGLSAGRVLFTLLATLLCFEGASLHLFPLALAPVVFALGAIGAALGWRDVATRVWVRENRRMLVFSDLIFATMWLLFLWIRLCHPEVGDLEKPMDMALMSGAMRAQWLPFQNPWFSGTPFTNYYYFGHLMAALWSRTLFVAPHLAYNLAQPTFCAFFLSTLWSVGAALSRSKWGGVGVMLLVGLGGHFEPLRQIKHNGHLWPLDWWTTSRVIENTINEYPAFTLGVGDMHGHFFALSIAMLWFALLLQLFESSTRRYRLTLTACGLVLGAWLMTNTWDVPLSSVLLIAVVVAAYAFQLQSRTETTPKSNLPAITGWMFVPFVLAVLVSRPYFALFHPQVKGAVFDAWLPDRPSLFLLWGSWWILGCIALALPREAEERARDEAKESDADAKAAPPGVAVPERWLRRCMTGVGLLALIAPYLFYINGYFGGEMRHQDTVFKFGLQAWLLLGTGIASELFARLREVWQRKPARVPIRAGVLAVGTVLAGLLALAPACVFWARAHDQGSGSWSLNGMRFLPQADQNAIVWLQTQAPLDAVVLEGVELNKDSNPIGDYDAGRARVSTFSGLPTPLGWPQHVWMWGSDYGQMMERGRQVAGFYKSKDFAGARLMFGNRYVFFGALEGPVPPETEAFLKPQKFDGDDGSQAAIGVVD